MSSEAIRHDTFEFTFPDPGIDNYNRRYADLALKHEIAPSRADNVSERSDSERPFIAARLPVMSIARSEEDNTEDMVNKRASLSSHRDPESRTATGTRPILTTTNAYIFPKRIYHVYCQPSAAWSGPSYSDMYQSQNPPQCLVFPKSALPRRTEHFRPTSLLFDSVENKQVVRTTGPFARQDVLWTKTSLPTPLPRLFESRCRSSTQDSFDSKFSVDTIVKQDRRNLSVERALNFQHSFGLDPAEGMGVSMTGDETAAVDDAQTDRETWTTSRNDSCGTALNSCVDGLITQSPEDCETANTTDAGGAQSEPLTSELEDNTGAETQVHNGSEDERSPQEECGWDEDEWESSTSMSVEDIGDPSSYDSDIWTW